MRTIKFRAWDKDNKKMLIPTSFHFICGQIDVVRIEEQTGITEGGVVFKKLIPIKNYELMQFTGLKDKNGREAYHKDIVRYDGDLWIMEWNENSSCFELRSIDGNEVTGMDYSMSFEIVGNVFENPELLEAK